MQYKCPNKDCKEITHKDTEKRYLHGKSREKRSSLIVILRKRICKGSKGSKGCGHQFIIKTELPLDAMLEPSHETSYDWAEFKNALKRKPGPPIGGTTVGEYTNDVHHDTAGIWWKVLGYDKPPAIDRRTLYA